MKVGQIIYSYHYQGWGGESNFLVTIWMTELERIMGMSFENSPIVKREAMRVSRGVKIVCQPHNGLAVCHKNNTFLHDKIT